MTAILDAPSRFVKLAVEQAEQLCTTVKDDDGVMQRRITIHSLTRAGYSAREIAGMVGITQRNVVRARKLPLPGDLPKLPAPHEIRVDRASEMAKFAEIVTGLAFRLRDQDPRVVRQALRLLSRNTIEELFIVALAAIDVDSELTEIYSWVLDLPAAKGVDDE